MAKGYMEGLGDVITLASSREKVKEIEQEIIDRGFLTTTKNGSILPTAKGWRTLRLADETPKARSKRKQKRKRKRKR